MAPVSSDLMRMRQAPPSRRSRAHDNIVKPRGAHQCFMCSGSTKARKTASRGALKRRVSVKSRTASSASSAFACTLLSFLQVRPQPIKPLIPELAVVGDPFQHLAQRLGGEPAGPALRLAAARDEAGALQHL